MPATPARIAFITQATRIVTAGPDAMVAEKFGSAARDTDTPLETFFDNVADAQAIADERLVLLKANRRRAEFRIAGEQTGLQLDYKGETPSARLIDDERALNMDAAIVQFGIDFQTEKTSVVGWG